MIYDENGHIVSRLVDEKRECNFRPGRACLSADWEVKPHRHEPVQAEVSVDGG